MTTASCSGCGFSGSRAACQDVFDDVSLRVRALAWTDSLKTWRLMHDVYSVQHPADFCGTYDRLVLHLGGVCWALEHGGQERGYRALQQAAAGAFEVADVRIEQEALALVPAIDRDRVTADAAARLADATQQTDREQSGRAVPEGRRLA